MVRNGMVLGYGCMSPASHLFVNFPSLGSFQYNSSQVPDLQGLMNPLYSQPFAHYNTQPLNLQAPQQQQQQQQQTPPQQGQSSQNQKLHYNG